MFSVVSAIRNTIPITQFNRGQAGQIFADVKSHGPKVVMKNSSAECVLISPEEYVQLMDEVNDARLLILAMERMEHYDPSQSIPADQVWERLGISQEELDAVGEIEFE